MRGLPEIEVEFKKVLPWLGYSAFFVFCFIAFAYWTFPYDRVRERIIAEAGKLGYDLEIVDLSPSRLTGATLTGVRVVLPEAGGSQGSRRARRTGPPPSGGQPPGRGGPPPELMLDELTVRASPLSWLFGRTAVKFDATLAGGELEGRIDLGSEDDMAFDAEFSDLDLRRIPATREFIPVPLNGRATGIIDVRMPADVEESTGEVDIRIADLHVGRGETKVEIPGWGSLTVGEANLGTFELVGTIEDGSFDIKRASANGPDIKLEAAGSVELARPFRRSLLDLLVRLKIEEGYLKKSEKVATALELASQQSGFKAAETADGALQYKVRGSLGGRLRPTPAGKERFRKPK